MVELIKTEKILLNNEEERKAWNLFYEICLNIRQRSNYETIINTVDCILDNVDTLEDYLTEEEI